MSVGIVGRKFDRAPVGRNCTRQVFFRGQRQSGIREVFRVVRNPGKSGPEFRACSARVTFLIKRYPKVVVKCMRILKMLQGSTKNNLRLVVAPVADMKPRQLNGGIL